MYVTTLNILLKSVDLTVIQQCANCVFAVTYFTAVTKRYVALLHLELTRQDKFFRVIYDEESVKWVFCIFT